MLVSRDSWLVTLFILHIVNTKIWLTVNKFNNKLQYLVIKTAVPNTVRYLEFNKIVSKVLQQFDVLKYLRIYRADIIERTDYSHLHPVAKSYCTVHVGYLWRYKIFTNYRKSRRGGARSVRYRDMTAPPPHRLTTGYWTENSASRVIE